MILVERATLIAGLLGTLIAHSGFAMVIRLPLNSDTVSQELQSIGN